MNSKILFTSIILTGTLVFSACNILGGSSSSSGTDPIGGDPTPLGAVGNSFDIPAFPGTSDRVVEVIARDGNISTIQGSVTVSNPMILEMAKSLPYLEVEGDKVSGSQDFRITDKGIQNVYDDGKTLTLVNYDAKKGDTYSLKRDGHTIRRKVQEVSSEDDFMWGFMYIKVIEIEETGSGIPGLSSVVYYANHRFGIVGFDVHYEDGSTTYGYVYSDNNNR